MQQHHLTVPRTARYWTMGSPGASVTQVWLACHGYGQLARELLESLRALEDPTRFVVAPEGLSRYYTNHAERTVGASWMTSEDRLVEIDDHVRYLDCLAEEIERGLDGATPERWALGFSQGAATVSRWVARGRASVDHLVLWGAGIPPDLEWEVARDRFSDLDVVLVYGVRDRYVTAERVAQEEARMRQQGITYRVLTFDGGHRLDDDTLRALTAGR